jgi:hypothetical protein
LFARVGHTHYLNWGPYAAFHGMALKCHIEGSMVTAIWIHLRVFQNSKLYQFIVNVEFCLSRCKGTWTVVCTWQYRPWTGSMQHFQFYRVRLSLGILISLYFFATLALFVPYGGCKSRPVHSIRDVIFPILKDRSARHYCCACCNLVLSIRLFSCWVVLVYLTWVLLDHPKDNVACFLNLSFDVLSVICRLHNLWSPFKIPFYLVPPIVFSFRAHALFYLGDHMPL